MFPSISTLTKRQFGGVRQGEVTSGRGDVRANAKFLIRQTPRHYVVLDTPERPRRAEEQYSYSYSSEAENTRSSSTSSPYSAPSRSYSSSSERVNRSAGSGPGSSYNYSTERSSRSSDAGPGGYHASYSSSTSGRLPHGTTYRHYSYRV